MKKALAAPILYSLGKSTYWAGMKRLVTLYVFFVISLTDRLVHVAGITMRPTEAWMLQVACNVTNAVHRALLGKCHVILDRDAKYSASLRRHVEESRIEVVRLPQRLPNLNAYAERCVRSIIEKCLSKKDDLC